MRAIICEKIGSIEDLKVGELPKPEPGAGEIRVRVHAVSLNFPDLLMPQGKYQYSGEPPFAPGSRRSFSTSAARGSRIFATRASSARP